MCCRLSHPVRRQILLTIWFRGGEMGSGDIADRFHHSWPTTTRHLRVLEDAELVIAEKQGRTRIYRVNRAKLAVVREWLAWFDGHGRRDGSDSGRR
jgi:DNA-binding transcriptional ArsR family regulator